ncbi:uncharacterized protein LOC143022981 [Oratosquilla oratoria]|uniref:uncharacterized protein LOC143022981 n=1 Tax=Oratosquilla oratoria TaxID=337810 RepID=UPI003F75E248
MVRQAARRPAQTIWRPLTADLGLLGSPTCHPRPQQGSSQDETCEGQALLHQQIAQSVLTLLCLGMDPLSPSDGRVCIPTREVPLMSPGSGSENGSAVVRPPQSKMDSIKTWSITTYKCMRQPTHLRETGQELTYR